MALTSKRQVTANARAALSSLLSLMMSRRWTIATLMVGSCLLAPSPAALAWQADFSGTEPVPFFESINDVAVLPGGDVVAAGTLENSSSGSCGDFETDMLIARFDGATGAVEWSAIISGGSGPGLGRDSARTIAVDSNGDVFAGGETLSPDGSAHHGAIVKLNGATGAFLWGVLVGTTGDACGTPERVTGLAVDADDNVVASVVRWNGSDRNFRVVKVDGATHALLWDYIEPTATSGEARDVAVDGAGNVLAIGGLMSGTSGNGFAAVKLSGTTGAELWKQEGIPGAGEGTYANRVTLDATGNLLITGASLHSYYDFTVVKLANTDGALLWRRVVDDGFSTAGFGWAAAVAASGTVFAVGRVSDQPHLVALNPSDGAVLWSRHDYGFAGSAKDVAVLANGNPVVALEAQCPPFFNPDCPDPYALAAAAADGTELWRATRPGDHLPSFVTIAVTPGGVVVGGILEQDASVVKLNGDDGSFSNCGDGNLESGEECDDGNVLNFDCCTATCQYQHLTFCSDGNPATTDDHCNPFGVCEACGNGVLESGEQCDDGNVANGDCCSSTCTIDPPLTPCDDGLPATTDDHCNPFGVCEACGNGALEAGEVCDDPGPGGCCTSSCQWAPADTPCDDGLACSTVDQCGSSGVCEPRSGDCCGDGMLQTTLGEGCDVAASCCISCQVDFGASCSYGFHPACNPGVCSYYGACADGPSVCGCCSAHGGPGCSDATCQDCVDNWYGPCSYEAWSSTCVSIASNQCAAACGCGGSTTTTTTPTTSTSTTTIPSPPMGHLKCYKIKDSRAKLGYTFDLFPALGFAMELGCQLRLGAKSICVEVDKQNVNPPPPGGGPASPPNAGSVFLSYKIKCPQQPAPSSITLGDQFGVGSFTIGAGSLSIASPKELLVPAVPGPANDHFTCYKARDTRPKASYTMDLIAGVSGFVNELGCTVKLGAKQVCVQVSKQNVAPSPPGGGPGAGPGAGGQFVSYKLKCPAGVVPPGAFSDQFGAGTFTPGTAKTLLVPAQ